ncbi:queuosine precursor transporter [Candidatus Dependentiae bacterium]|nr:queuosine precursor transporter [Candidatus Dependentiae bacterium]MBU4386945.1 queuosine precursor transporter [Candidatus Dependentiae bacterium]MCG2756255.1 queuosine precursor transporter [Candidatus Dependentiae bacterium]
MNELIFFLHIISVVVATFLALRLGKSALVGLICLETVLSNLFVLKQMTIFGLNATCADVFVIGIVLGINLLQEYFGIEFSKKTIKISFFAMFFYLLMSFIHLSYIPSQHDWAHILFNEILRFTPRIVIASMFAYFVSLRFNASFYARLNEKFDGKYLVLRNIISIIFTQLIDTIIFVFVGLFGIVGSPVQVIVVGFSIKVLITFIAMPIIGFTKKYLIKNLDSNDF